MKGTARPASGVLQTKTTGTSAGGDGEYRFSGVTAGTYFVAIEYLGTTLWDTFEIQATVGPTSVKQYGAVGDGLTNDTAAVQAALNDTAQGYIVFPAGTYLCSGLTLSNRSNFILEGQGATILWTGTAAAGDQVGLQLTGANTNVVIRCLEFLGDGVAADGHAGVWWKNGASVQQIRIEDCFFTALARGVAGTRSSSGTWADIRVSGCFFDRMVGTGSSQGEGVAFDTNAAVPMHLEVVGNCFSQSDQYSVHLSQGIGATVTNNRFRNHRLNTASGAVKAAVRVNRFRDVVIADNYFQATNDGAVELTPTSGTTLRNVVIEGNLITDAANAVEDITIGSTAPATDGAPEEVLVRGNLVYKSGRNAAAIRLNAGKRVRIDSNGLNVLAVSSGTVPILDLQGTSDSGGTATYTDEVEIAENLLYGTNSGGTATPIYLRSAFCTSTIHASFRNNRASSGLSYGSAASVTDPNLVAVGEVSGFTFASGVTFASQLYGPLQANGLCSVSGNGTGNTGGLTLSGAGISIGTPTVKTGSYTLLDDDFFVIADTTSGSVTLTLPAASGRKRLFAVKKAPSSANTMTVSPTGGDTIDGGASLSVGAGTVNSGWLLQSDGVSKWYAIANI